MLGHNERLFLAQVYSAQLATGGYMRAEHVIENKSVNSPSKEQSYSMLKNWCTKGWYTVDGPDIGMGMLTEEGMAAGKSANKRVKVDTSYEYNNERERILIFLAGLTVLGGIFVYMIHSLFRLFL
jgi:hypothetical protein